MQSNENHMHDGVLAQASVSQAWPLNLYEPTMQQMQPSGADLSHQFGGYCMPYSAYGGDWMMSMQPSFLHAVADMSQPEVPGESQHFPTWPLVTESMAAMQLPALEVDQGSAHQRQKKQRQSKGKHAMGKGRKHSNDDDEFSSNPDAADQDSDGAVIKMLVDGLLRELRSGSVPRAQLAIANYAQMIFQDKTSSRAAQLALETASAAEQISLSSGLCGRVIPAMQSKNANYAVTKTFEVMPAGRIAFIVEELIGHGCDLAKHRFGCRVICRILEHHSAKDTKSMELLDEVLKDAESLCTHAFGSIVMRHFLEYGQPAHKHRVATALSKDLTTCALQRKGSHVVEAALRFCSEADRDVLVEQLLRNSDDLLAIATGQFGRHVVHALLNCDSAKSRQLAIEALLPLAEGLSTSKHGRNVCSLLPSSTSRL